MKFILTQMTALVSLILMLAPGLVYSAADYDTRGERFCLLQMVGASPPSVGLETATSENILYTAFFIESDASLPRNLALSDPDSYIENLLGREIVAWDAWKSNRDSLLEVGLIIEIVSKGQVPT